MRFSVCAITLATFFAAGIGLIGEAQEGYEITVRIENISDPVAYLGYHYGNQKYIRDTARVQNSTMIFAGDEKLPAGIYFVYTPKIFLELIVKDQHFSVQTDTVDLLGNFKVQGSPENEIFSEFKIFRASSHQEFQDLSARLATARNRADSIEVEEEIEALKAEIEVFKTALIEQNPQTFVSKALLMNEKVKVPEDVGDPAARYFYYRQHYFDHLDFTDASSLRTPVFHSAVMEYFDKLTLQHPDSIIKAVDYVLGLATNEDIFRYLLVKFANKYETSKIMGMENVFVYVAENYYMQGKADWADPALLSKIEKRVRELKPNLIGNTAPPMFLLDTLDHRVSLYEINRDYLVLYFYDPNCGHCKKKTPVLRQSYDQLKRLGVEVVAICTTAETSRWKEFIQQNDLVWTNLADPYFHSNFRKDYNVATTPIVYILDRDKKIIAKNLAVEQIPEFIQNRVEREN